MSEFIAEAQVLIVPNTAAFAASLKAQLEAAVAAAGPVLIPVAAAPVATGAATAAARETAAAAQVQGAATAQAAAATTSLTRAEAAAAVAAQKLAFAQEEVAGAASTASAAQIAFTRSTAAVAAAQRQVSAALLTNDAALTKAAAESLALAEAQALEAEAALVAARAQAAHATSLSQLGRGAGATTLSFLGLRGATLAASAAFLAGAAGVVVAAKSIGAASDRTEQLNKSVEVFVGTAPEVQAWAETTATSMGISETAALAAASTFGELFRTLNVGPDEAAKLSQALVGLASDLASFNNVDTDRALQAIQSGLVGQARPLRQLGVFLTEARVKEEALTQTGKKLASQLTQQDKILAREALIFKDAAIQQGDFERTSGRLANQSRILTAQIDDLAAGIGSTLLPVLTDVVITTNAAVTGLRKLSGFEIVPGGADVKELFGWVTGWKELGILWDHSIFPGLFNMEKGIPELTGIIGRAEQALLKLAAAFQKFGDAMAAPTGAQQSALDLSLAQASGNQAQELALLQEKAAKQEAFLEKQLSKPQTSKRVALEKKAADNLTQTNNQIQAILNQQASDSAKAAADQKQARDDAIRAQTEATQAFIDSFSGQQQRLQNQLTSAELFGSFKQQIAINKAIKAANKAEIAAIKERIRQLHLHGDALKAAKDEIARLIQENFNILNQIIQLQAQRKQAIADTRQSHLEAQLAIAETTASNRDDAAAQKALIKFDQAQIRRILAIKRRRRLTQDEAAQLDAYRVDLAQRNAALKGLKEEADDTGKKMKELLFSFLQTQQGFAANLLGNLIPGFATGGLVGGSTPGASGAGPAGLAAPQQRVEQSAAVGAGRERGVRPVQVDTTNQILRQILRSLQNLNGRAGHPEARYQKATGSANFDTL